MSYNMISVHHLESWLLVKQNWTTKYFHDIDLDLDEINLKHS